MLRASILLHIRLWLWDLSLDVGELDGSGGVVGSSVSFCGAVPTSALFGIPSQERSNLQASAHLQPTAAPQKRALHTLIVLRAAVFASSFCLASVVVVLGGAEAKVDADAGVDNMSCSASTWRCSANPTNDAVIGVVSKLNSCMAHRSNAESHL